MDVAASAITFVTTAYSLYNTIKAISGLPKEFDETGKHLQLALDTLDEFKKHLGWNIEPERRAAIEEILKPCNKSAQKLKAIFESVKKHEGKDGLSRYRIAVIKLGKASRVEVLLQEIMKSIKALALNSTVRMHNSVSELTNAIEALTKVKSSIPDEDFEEEYTTNFTQHIATGATGHQTSNRNIEHQNNNFGGINYLSSGGTINIGAGSPRERRDRVLRSLDRIAYWAAKDRNDRPVPGTCKWVVEHKVFLEWKNKQSSALLWLSADPGCGKSVLARHLIDTVLEDRKPCYFFFKDGYMGQTTVDSALSCILHQLLAAHYECFSEKVLRRFEQSSQVYNSTPDLWDILQTVVEAIGSETLCIIDAFDECSFDDAQNFANILRDYYGRPSATRNLKFLVTSRPYGNMRRNFRTEEHISIIKINGETPEEINKITKEIDIFMKWEISVMQKSGHITDVDADNLGKWLHEVPNRSYLWAHLVLEEINQQEGVHIKLIVSDLPRTVSDSYERILTKTSKKYKRKTVEEVLHIILAAARPLSVAEMYAALTVQPTHKLIDDIESPPKNFEAHIRDVCGLFVYILDSKVYLFHQTAREFLVAQDSAPKEPVPTGTQWEQSFQKTDSHLILYQKCVQYLLLVEKVPATNIDYCIENYPLYTYSFENWAQHYRFSDTRDQLGMSLLNFDPESKTPTQPGRWCVAYFRQRLKESLDETFTPLMAASYFGLEEIVDRVIKSSLPALNHIERQTRRSALSFAAENGHTKILAALIHKCDTSFERPTIQKWQFVHNVCSEGKTPLIYAASNGHTDSVRLLVGAGAETGTEDDLNGTALSYALAYGHLSAADAIAGSTPIDIANELKENLLLSAVRMLRTDIVERLIKSGVNADVRDRSGRSPLHYMIEAQNLNMVRLLLNLGVDADFPTGNGYSPFYISIDSDDDNMSPISREIFNKLQATKYDDPRYLVKKEHVSLIDDTELMATTKALFGIDEEELAERLLNYCSEPLSLVRHRRLKRRRKDLFSEVVLNWIAKANASTRAWAFSRYGDQLQDIEIKAMKDLGMDLETRDTVGQTPIFDAAMSNDPNLLQAVIDAGAVVDAVDYEWRTPLFCSALAGNYDSTRVLLKNGASIEAKDGVGLTPLLAVAMSLESIHDHLSAKKLETLDVLLEYGADVEARDNQRKSCLEYSFELNGVILVSHLLMAGADANALFSDGKTPLQSLAKRIDRSSDGIRRLLYKHGAK